MVVFVGNTGGISQSQPTGHAQMDEEVGFARKMEEHLLAVCAGTFQPPMGEGGESACGALSENPGLGMGEDRLYGFTHCGEPLFAIKFDFGEFGHEGGNDLRVAKNVKGLA